MDIKRFKAWAESKKLSTDGETGRNYSYTFYDSKTQAAWGAWQATKAQAVPEGFVLVPKLSANYLFNKVPELGFKHKDEEDTVLYHLNYMASEFRDSAKQFTEDDHEKQKAMIEEEQSHE